MYRKATVMRDTVIQIVYLLPFIAALAVKVGAYTISIDRLTHKYRETPVSTTIHNLDMLSKRERKVYIALIATTLCAGFFTSMSVVHSSLATIDKVGHGLFALIAGLLCISRTTTTLKPTK